MDTAAGRKRLLQAPKQNLSKFHVSVREYLARNGHEPLPVTRLALTAMTGRKHQLNVHLAVFGHPIVGDESMDMGRCASEW